MNHLIIELVGNELVSIDRLNFMLTCKNIYNSRFDWLNITNNDFIKMCKLNDYNNLKKNIKNKKINLYSGFKILFDKKDITGIKLLLQQKDTLLIQYMLNNDLYDFNTNFVNELVCNNNIDIIELIFKNLSSYLQTGDLEGFNKIESNDDIFDIYRVLNNEGITYVVDNIVIIILEKLIRVAFFYKKIKIIKLLENNVLNLCKDFFNKKKIFDGVMYIDTYFDNDFIDENNDWEYYYDNDDECRLLNIFHTKLYYNIPILNIIDKDYVCCSIINTSQKIDYLYQLLHNCTICDICKNNYTKKSTDFELLLTHCLQHKIYKIYRYYDYLFENNWITNLKKFFFISIKRKIFFLLKYIIEIKHFDFKPYIQMIKQYMKNNKSYGEDIDGRYIYNVLSNKKQYNINIFIFKNKNEINNTFIDKKSSEFTNKKEFIKYLKNINIYSS